MKITRTIIAAALAFAPTQTRAVDRGYFNCFHLTDEQREWFKTTGVSHCCDLSDGMPSRFEERAEGTFVPPFLQSKVEAEACRDAPDVAFGDGPMNEDRSHWFRVPESQMLRKNNPIGIGVIWWTNDTQSYHWIRCFVGLPRV